VRFEEGVKQGCFLLPIIFNLDSEYFSNKVIEELGGLKVKGEVTRFMRHADDRVLWVRKKRWYYSA
jgi:hypothetical protein